MNYNQFLDQVLGNQSFDPKRLKEIITCIRQWDAKNFAFFISLTRKFDGKILFSADTYGPGVHKAIVKDIWEEIQEIDSAGYWTLYWGLLIPEEETATAYPIVPPPPKPPPGEQT